MQRIVKNTMLNYLPARFEVEEIPRRERIFEVNKKPVKNGSLIYFIEREMRLCDNFSLNFARQKAQELNKNLKIVHLRKKFETRLKIDFYNARLKELEQAFKNYDFEIREDTDGMEAGAIVTDFNPILPKNYLKSFDCKIFEVDSHNIVPARYASGKQEYNAATFRRKIYADIAGFLNEFPSYDVPETEAALALRDFIETKLDLYAEYKNNPENDVTSHLSKYLKDGYLSAQRAALEVIKSNASNENKETFLEELIVRGELSENFCLYCTDFKSFECVPGWAKASLAAHRWDFRQFLYTKEEFEQAKTHDKLWNYAQLQLLETGKIHGYLRMYWAKKMLEWSKTPEEALEISIYLNDKYALDAPSANGYVGILWSIAALHDRAFADRPVTGKIRYMSGKKIKLG